MATESTILQPSLAADAYPLSTLLHPLPPMHCLQAFLAVAELGSLSQAAIRLHRTQGAISRQIQQLEQLYGIPLFVRNAQGMALNPAGLQLLPDIRQALGLLTAHFTSRAMHSIRLRLQVPTTLGLRWLLPQLPRLKEQLPDIELQLSTHNSDHPALVQLGCDAAIVRGGSWPGVESQALFSESLLPVCAPALLPMLGSFADLLSQPLLHPEQGNFEWQCWLTHQQLPSPTQAGTHFDSQEMALTAASLGQGVAIADPRMLHALLARGELTLPFPNAVPSGYVYQLIYPPGHPYRYQLGQLADQLKRLDECGPGTPPTTGDVVD